MQLPPVYAVGRESVSREIEKPTVAEATVGSLLAQHGRTDAGDLIHVNYKAIVLKCQESIRKNAIGSKSEWIG